MSTAAERFQPTLFNPDLSIITHVAMGRGARTGKLKPRLGMSSIVVHTTGRGVIQRARMQGMDPFHAAIQTYAQRMDASGHFVIGQGAGEIAQVVPVELAAQHVAAKESGWALDPDNETTAWWFERWSPRLHPYEICGPEGEAWGKLPKGTRGQVQRSVNLWSVGIEIVPPEVAGKHLSAHAWSSLVSLIEALCAPNGPFPGFARTRETVLTHSDLAPRARTGRTGEPWDPPPSQWTWEQYAKRAGL